MAEYIAPVVEIEKVEGDTGFIGIAGLVGAVVLILGVYAYVVAQNVAVVTTAAGAAEVVKVALVVE